MFSVLNYIHLPVKVTHYPYRSAQVTCRVCSINIKEGDAFHKLHQELAEYIGQKADKPYKSRTDNHECFVLQNENSEGKVCLQFSDWMLYIGTEIELGIW